jgi:hypothetical protein
MEVHTYTIERDHACAFVSVTCEGFVYPVRDSRRIIQPEAGRYVQPRTSLWAVQGKKAKGFLFMKSIALIEYLQRENVLSKLELSFDKDRDIIKNEITNNPRIQ